MNTMAQTPKNKKVAYEASRSNTNNKAPTEKVTKVAKKPVKQRLFPAVAPLEKCSSYAIA